MKEWFYGLTRGKQIVIGVLLAHAFCLLILMTDYFCKMRPAKRHKIAVNMVQIEAPKKPAAVVKVAPVKPASKKVAPVKAPPKPTPTPKKKEVAPPPPQKSVDASLLKEIEDNLEILSNHLPPTQQKTVIQIPTFSEARPRESNQGTMDETIAAFLQEALTLPEFGEVKVFLSIDTVGQLQSLEIISSRSEKNARFLKNRLPELHYPCLNEGASLTIVFSNAL